jgi:hypothetical protein
MFKALANLASEASSRNDRRRTSDPVEKGLRKLFRDFQRDVERPLQKDRPRLFRALEEFANTRSDAQAWEHFQRRWPTFFPAAEYDRAKTSGDSVRNYPEILDRVWRGYESGSVFALLGIGVEAWRPANEDPPPPIHRIPAQFFANWDEGVFVYRGLSDFQNALYLLFLESWRARVCEHCGNKFIAKRAAQRYCTTDCSENMQRELKRTWWKEHGEKWRQRRNLAKSRERGGKNVTRKTR